VGHDTASISANTYGHVAQRAKVTALDVITGALGGDRAAVHTAVRQRQRSSPAPEIRTVTCGDGSPGWTRTNNPSVNSRMLCQLSYRGSLSPHRLARRIGPLRIDTGSAQTIPTSAFAAASAVSAAARANGSAGSTPSSYS
jgi:hypothetical protein